MWENKPHRPGMPRTTSIEGEFENFEEFFQ